MNYDKFIEVFESMFTEDERAKIDLNMVNPIDIRNSYNWCRSRVGRCTCSFNLKELDALDKCVVLRVLYTITYDIEKERATIDKMSLDALKDEGLLGTSW